MNAVTPLDVLPERPYPGLRAFLQEEWPIFFGRERHVDDVISRLGRQGFVLVHGSSGCGKSSLIRAGVLPTLATHHEAQRKLWRTATMRPSEGLLTRLGEVLDEALPPPAGAAQGDDAQAESADWADLVIEGGGLVDRIEETLRPSGGSFCLLIDQFEEIFRAAREGSDAEVRLFIEFLMHAGHRKDGGAFYVILTMRSDYFGECARYDGFAEFVNQRQYLLPRMDERGLLRAIHEPAGLYGGSVDTAVAASLLPVIKRERDGLPVLQHAMMRASEEARKRPGAHWVVTADDLTKVGGAERALAEHAKDVLDAATHNDPELVEAAEWIFRALTDLDANRRQIRRPCQLRELIAVSGVGRKRTLAILKPFRAPGCSFISPYLPEHGDDEEPIDDEKTIGDEDEFDISHEALIRQWPKLCDTGIDQKTSRPNGWVYREFHDGLVWRSLVVQSMAYAEDRNHLLSVATTEQRLPWFRAIEARPGWTGRHALSERRGDAASTDEQWRNVKAMMDASAQNLARQQGIIGRLRRVRNGSLILVVLAVAALVALGWGYVKQTQQQTRLTQQEVLLRNQHDELVRQKRGLLDLLRFSTAEIVRTVCSPYRENSDEFQTCRAQAESQLQEQLELRRVRDSDVSAPTSRGGPQ